MSTSHSKAPLKLIFSNVWGLDIDCDCYYVYSVEEKAAGHSVYGERKKPAVAASSSSEQGRREFLRQSSANSLSYLLFQTLICEQSTI